MHTDAFNVCRHELRESTGPALVGPTNRADSRTPPYPSQKRHRHPATHGRPVDKDKAMNHAISPEHLNNESLPFCLPGLALLFCVVVAAGCANKTEQRAMSERAAATPVAVGPGANQHGSVDSDDSSAAKARPVVGVAVSSPSPGVLVSAAPSIAGAECATARDCAYEILGSIDGEDDCACPACPAEVSAVPRSTYEEHAAAFRRFCHKWAKAHACPPHTCPKPSRLECTDGKCSLGAGRPADQEGR